MKGAPASTGPPAAFKVNFDEGSSFQNVLFQVLPIFCSDFHFSQCDASAHPCSPPFALLHAVSHSGPKDFQGLLLRCPSMPPQRKGPVKVVVFTRVSGAFARRGLQCTSRVCPARPASKRIAERTCKEGLNRCNLIGIGINRDVCSVKSQQLRPPGPPDLIF